MPYSQKFYERLKQYFAYTPNVEEKKMFSGIAFMVNGKICVTVGPERIMCRIDPELHAEAIKKKGARTVQMRGRDYKGYVHVAEDAVSTKKELDYWIKLSLDFNERANASRKKKKQADEEISCESLF